MKKDDLAIKEAKAKGIKIIGISDTNVNPNLIDYPIPANDDTISSLMYILEKVKLAVEVGREIAQEKNKIEEIKKDEK
jgi:small subunit ribosomal protein S2